MSRTFWIASIGFLVFFLALPQAQATPTAYRMDFILAGGGPQPFPTTFTYDPVTRLFADLTITWPVTPFFSIFDYVGNNVLQFSVNDFPQPQREAFMAMLADGGSFEFRTSTIDFDAFVNLDGDIRTFLNAGNKLGDTATGTFVTTPVPEPASALLSLMGALLFVAARRKTHNSAS
jgi:hypothetical protein